MRNFRKALGAGLLALAAILLTLKFKAALGWSPDFLLPALAAAGFVLDIYSLALIAILAAWIINWQSGLPPELFILIAAPLAAWAGKRYLPSASWFTLAAVIVAGEAALYAAAGTGVFVGNLGFIVCNALFAVFFGLALLNLLEYVYGRE